MKNSLFIVSFFLLSLSFAEGKSKEKCSQKPEQAESLKWLDIEAALLLFNKEKKPILIDLYTDWCTWCKVMERTTYGDPRVIAYLNKNFYIVKFNAESKTEINFFDKTFKYGSYGEMHDLAVFLTNGNLAFPTTIILPENNPNVGVFPGYLKVKDIEPLIKFYGEKKNAEQTFKEFRKSFVSTWN